MYAFKSMLYVIASTGCSDDGAVWLSTSYILFILLRASGKLRETRISIRNSHYLHTRYTNVSYIPCQIVFVISIVARYGTKTPDTPYPTRIRYRHTRYRHNQDTGTLFRCPRCVPVSDIYCTSLEPRARISRAPSCLIPVHVRQSVSATLDRKNLTYPTRISPSFPADRLDSRLWSGALCHPTRPGLGRLNNCF